MQLLQLIIYPLLCAFLFSYAITPGVIYFAKKYGLVDDPRTNKHPKVIHTVPIPRAGGLGIGLSIISVSFFFLSLDQRILAILVGAIPLLIIGVLDDKYNISPYLRALVQIGAALIPIGAGIGIAFVTSPFGGILDLSYPRIYFDFLGESRSIWVLSDLFALFWIVFLMNIINMGAKGLPGQMPGVVVIAALVIAFLSLQFANDTTEWPVTILASLVAGSFLGFLPWNFLPQRIMPGFSGSMIAGYFLAILSILSTAKVGTLLVALGIPIIDTTYTVIRRISEGKSPVWGDRKHLHHRLLDSGVSKNTITYIYWGGTLLLGLLALQLKADLKFYTIIGVALFLGGILIWLTYRLK